MSYILDISTAVPDFSITNKDLVKFYAKALQSSGLPEITKKLNYLIEKTKIVTRHTCISDFNGDVQELYTNENYQPPVEQRMAVYKEKIMPLASKAIDQLFFKNNLDSDDITHLITISCTGVFAPGLEFLVAEHYNLQHTEKVALNFLGCYAAVKALKHAHYIAEANPDACILIVSAELCSLHFYPSIADEDILANLLFTDGAAAVLVCGEEHPSVKSKKVLKINAIGSAYIPNTLDLMTWNISSSAFRMYLSKHLVKTIKENIAGIANKFLMHNGGKADYWAIHPGGVKIVEAVKESLNLSDNNVADSLAVLHRYGNMSSPTILFILNRLLNKLTSVTPFENKSIFTCAFGPGLNIEMIHLSAVSTVRVNEYKRYSEIMDSAQIT